MKVRSLGLIVMTGSIAIGAPVAGLAQQDGFDGAYKGSLDCEQMPTGILRASLAVTVRNSRIIVSFDMFDINANRQFVLELATGTVHADGTFHLGDTVYTKDATFHGAYTGTFSATGGTIAGTQVWTRSAAEGDSVTRTCNGTFVKVGSPGQQ
jgi:hypothetical protein